MATKVWSDDGTQVGKALADWQSGWTIFYWAWWIAFAPFVGLFFARVSRGRSIREYVFGTMVIPSIMGFVWFAIIGGTALNLEITGRCKWRNFGCGFVISALRDTQCHAWFRPRENNVRHNRNFTFNIFGDVRRFCHISDKYYRICG